MGYVGLCTAATFASRSFRTVGIDIDQERIRQIRNGKAPFHEPQLDGMLEKAVKNKTLDATTDISAVRDTRITFVTVGTPSSSDGSIDLMFLKKAIIDLGRTLYGKIGYHLVVVKSTVVPGTTSNVVKLILEHFAKTKVGSKLGLCVNPEFLKEGTAINDALHPDKIVIGSSDKKSTDKLTELYEL